MLMCRAPDTVGPLTHDPVVRSKSGIGNRRADEALHHTQVGGGPCGERSRDFVVVVEVATAVGVEHRHGGVVIGEVEAVHLPATSVVVGVAWGGRGDVERLCTEELVDGV